MKLGELPDAYLTTRAALHQIAFFAVAPARYDAVGRMGLTAAPGGFGTPEFGESVARVEGDTLVHETSDAVASRTITTVRAATAFFGLEYDVDWFSDFRDPLDPVDPDLELEVDDASARGLGNWFNFGFDVLGRLRTHGVAGDDVSEVQLWPEHFDPAVELGSQDQGQRASFGASPGDAGHPDPYLYVAPWGEVDRSHPFWNDDAFGGASLDYAELRRSIDPIGAGVDFLLEGYRTLHAT